MAAPTFVGASTGLVITGTSSTSVPCDIAGLATGDLLVLHVLKDGTSGIQPTATALVNVVNLAGGAANLSLSAIGQVGNPAAADQWVWLGRYTGGGAASASVTSAGGDDAYCRWYAFRAVATGTTQATVIENSTGTTADGFGTGTVISDTGVVTLGADRLACQFVAVNDDNPVDAFTGMSGGTWAEAVAEFASATGTDGCIQLQTATIASAGTINGGSFTMAASDGWGVIGLALIPVPSGPATLTRAAALNATGLILVVGRETLARLAALNATGAVTSSAVFWTTLERAVAANATGGIAAAGVRLAPPFTRSAAFAATAAIGSAGISIVSASAAVTATAAIVTVGREELARTASLSATANIASAGLELLPRLAELAAAANISVVGQVAAGGATLERSATLAATGAISTVGRETLARTASLAATASISTVGLEVLPRAAVVTAAATITTAGQKSSFRAAALTATATVTAAGEIEGALARAASLAATAAVSASGAVTRLVSRFAAIAATGALQAVPQRSLARTATVSTTGTVAATGRLTLTRTAGLEAVAAISTVAGGNVGEASFTAVGTITLSRAVPAGYITSTRAGRIAVIYQGQIPVSGLGGIEYPGADEGKLAVGTVGGIARTGG